MYRAPWYLPGRHLQTIYPALFRWVKPIAVERRRIETPDGDFLDLDWTSRKHSKLAIICHGLEGHSRTSYSQGMARAMYSHGWDALCWNFRGCSGEPNRLLRSYHSGQIEDLHCVVQNVATNYDYKQIALIGFSLGGNLILKYLGDQGSDADSLICGSVTFSVPCDLASSSIELARFSNRIYMIRFMRSLKRKIKLKAAKFPQKLDTTNLNRMRTFLEFDDEYTAPLNGFKDAMDYWTKCSSLPVLEKVKIPTLMVSAANDPFLPEQCYPNEEVRNNDFLKLEVPRQGGHVGFTANLEGRMYWSEWRAVSYLKEISGT